jgi:type VI secretion system ImpM family protein
MTAPGRTGFVGPLPGRAGLVDGGLPSGLLTRWDRWFELASARRLPDRLDPDRPAWRLMARPGLFAPVPVAGCFRLGRDRRDRIYPFAVLREGEPPDPADPWFDAAERLVRAATDGRLAPPALDRAADAIPAPLTAAPPPEEVALLWRDDWEVREVRCASAADLAAFPLSDAAFSRPEEEVLAWA